VTIKLSPISGGDEFYAELIAAQADLCDEAAADWLARLALILCNHIGDPELLREALKLASERHD
jgi:hypothetical protein